MIKNSYIYFAASLTIALLCALWLPWYGIILAGLIAGSISTLHLGKVFVLGFLSTFLLYSIVAIWLDNVNEGVLSARISTLFMGLPTFALAALSGIIAACLFSFSAAFSSAFMRFITKK
jgi:hypothetical protein